MLISKRSTKWLTRWPSSFLQMVLDMLSTTKSIGISASKLVRQGEARMGQRLFVNPLATRRQKCANRCARDNALHERSPTSSLIQKIPDDHQRMFKFTQPLFNHDSDRR